MSSIGIAELTALGAAPASGDKLVVVDVSDLGQSLAGSTKNMLVSDLFTSPTMTGTTAVAALTVSSTLAVTGNFTVNTNKFTVAAASGNTAVAGTLAVTGAVSVSTGGAGDNKITIGSAVAAAFSDVVFRPDALNYGWLIGAQVNVNNGFEITPSTVVGGTTFTTPVFKVMQTGNTTATGTITGTRLIGGTDISTAVAYAVLGDATALEPTWGFASPAGILGLMSSVSTGASSGTVLHAHFQTKQTVATSGTTQGLETWTWASHTSGTVAGLFGLIGNTAVSGVGGTTTNVVCVTGGSVVSGGTVTTLKGVNSGSTVDGASSVVTNCYGLYSKSPIVSNSGTITNNYGLRIETMDAGSTLNWTIACSSSTTSGGTYFRDTALATGATVGHLFIPSSAGAPTGVPANIPTGQVALQYDSSNNQIYVYTGAWKKTVILT